MKFFDFFTKKKPCEGRPCGCTDMCMCNYDAPEYITCSKESTHIVTLYWPEGATYNCCSDCASLLHENPSVFSLKEI